MEDWLRKAVRALGVGLVGQKSERVEWEEGMGRTRGVGSRAAQGSPRCSEKKFRHALLRYSRTLTIFC